MPLRSVEAATREDAIAAAREQFGPSARVIGVRRVRSGGVLGFFTTERYVAEVEPVPVRRSIGTPDRDGAPRQGSVAERAAQLAAFLQQQESEQRVEEITELFSGGAAEDDTPTYSRASFQRPAAPRPAAAASGPARTASSMPFHTAPASFPAAPASFPAAPASFAAPAEEPPAPEFPRVSFAQALRNATEVPGRGTPSPILREEPAEPAAPSPFTAALARMVAGDHEVRQAVQDALDSQLAGDSGAHEGPWTAGTPRAEPIETNTGAVHQTMGAEHQEEKPVSQLETTSGASPTGQSLPTWADAPPAASSSREDAIAQILRTALAQNHSDDALADILRKVLADASTAPAPAPVPAANPEPAWREPAAAPLWAPAPAATAWPVEAPMPTTPVAFPEPVRSYAEVPDDVVVPIDLGIPAPAPAPMPTAPIPMPSTDTVEAAEVSAVEAVPPTVEQALPLAEVAEDEPIWAEVVLHEPAPTQEVAAQPAAPATAATLAEVIRAQIMGGTPAAEQSPVAQPAQTPAAELPVEQEVRAEEEVAAEPVEDAAEAIAVESEHVLVEDAVAETAVAEEPAVSESAQFAMPELARTASDPAPLPADATTVMPALSLLPPLPGARRGSRPPVPPPSRPAVPPSRPAAEEDRTEAPEALATVTMLPVVPLAQPELPAEDEIEKAIDDVAVEHVEAENLDAFASVAEIEQPGSAIEEYVAAVEALIEPVAAVPTEELPAAAPAAAAEQPADVVSRLRALGIPEHLLGPDFAADAAVRGTYAALTASLARRLPEAPVLPTGAGEVLFVVGDGVTTLRAARSLAASVGLHPDCVQWASRGELAGLAPKNSRMSTIDDALDRRQEAVGCGTVTIVAVDAPLRSDAYWMGQMLAVWTPVAVWAVAEATRKPEDLGEWLDELPRVDALVLQDTDLSADPAAVLERVSMPVALLDGIRATPHRWASLLCERLETGRA